MDRRQFLKLLGTGAAIVAARPWSGTIDAAMALAPSLPPPPELHSFDHGFWKSWRINIDCEMVDVTNWHDATRHLDPGPKTATFEGESYHMLDYNPDRLAVVDVMLAQGSQARLLVLPTCWDQACQIDEESIWHVSGLILYGRIRNHEGGEHYIGSRGHHMLIGHQQLLEG